MGTICALALYATILSFLGGKPESKSKAKESAVAAFAKRAISSSFHALSACIGGTPYNFMKVGPMYTNSRVSLHEGFRFLDKIQTTTASKPHAHSLLLS